MHIDFPYHLDGRGRTATTGDADYVRDLIEGVLFTTPGERVNRPDFGSGLLQLVFEPNSVVLAGVIETTAQAALQQHLGDLVVIEGVDVVNEDATLGVTVRYVLRQTQERQVAQFSQEVG